MAEGHWRRSGRAGGSARPGGAASRIGPQSISVAVAVVLATVLRRDLRVLLVQRGRRPYRGRWALPCTDIGSRESLDGAAARMIAEQTGIKTPLSHLEQVRTYDDPDHRDPEGRVLTVAYWGIAPLSAATVLDASVDRTPPGTGHADRAGHAEFMPVPEIESGVQSGRLLLAFDHERIVADALDQIRSSLETRTIARRFCPPEFTIGQLREVYEAAWGLTLDHSNFQRKILSERFVAPAAAQSRRVGRRGRPPRMWRAAEGDPRFLESPFAPAWRRQQKKDG